LQAFGKQTALIRCFEITGTAASRFDGVEYPVYEELMTNTCLQLALFFNLGKGSSYSE
jgi:hypothetical protein